MSRLSRWFKKFNKVKGRKQARYRAYRSETMAFKMKQIKRQQKQRGRGREGR